ncbi:cytochrome c-type biogenesis protein CcmH [Aromatoleum tolulyticum]|uniref:Cytochrome c-type biogenesis protein CcmH n=1 Tax=Aromatoleum tolulyticum TaxID=34027 RepID=A0A1N6ZK83_9RHOO|nr:c-type cytochrome biogenesis protein CcmI [Aromatoleum tolulyticum]SIR27235.1 cytochrome c-type biogenesis protein CcmH [Aromatoleum tolulyticum]
MTVFLILATLLVAGALLLVIPPMLGTGAKAREHAARQEQARTVLIVLREQLAELEADHAAGRLAEADYKRSREELEQRALTEAGTAEAGVDAAPARGWALGVVFAVPVLAVAVYLLLGTPEGLDPASAKPAPEAGHQITPEQMQAMVGQLADRLEREPGDVQGWMMLGRSYAVMQNFQGAVATWNRIGTNIPDHPDILADWADLLAGAAGRKFEGDPDRLITRALELAPNHVKALALSGTSAFVRHDYATASAQWEKILATMQPGDGAYSSILASINEARAKGGMAVLSLPAGAQVAGMGGPAAREEGAQTSSAPLTLRGRLTLAPELAQQANSDATVFVFARPPQGGMPLAALRVRAGDLPIEFDFRNAQRMSQGPLPEQIAVGARLSKGGNATAAAGDLESQTVLAAPDAQGVSIVIDRVRK